MGEQGVEFTGKNVDEAIAEGLRALGLTADQAEIEVLSKGSRGIFGIGSEPARVRIVARPTPSPQEPIPAPSPAEPAPPPLARPRRRSPNRRPAGRPNRRRRPPRQQIQSWNGWRWKCWNTWSR